MKKRETIEETIADLSNADPLIVIKALDRLYNDGIPTSHSFEQIISLLSNQNWKIRAKSARCLEFTDSRADAAVTALTGALSDPVAHVQINAALALEIIGCKSSPDILAAAVLALRNTLNDSRPSVRLIVGKSLKSLGYEAEGEKAIQEWHNRVIEKKLPKPGTIEKYVAALNDSDPKKRISAMRKLSFVINEWQPDLNMLIIPCVPDLIILLGDPSWKVRSWAVRLLGQIGPDADSALPYLVLALQDRTIPVRECAAYAIGRLGEKANSAIPVLEITLHDPVRSVRTHAHMALRKLHHEDDALGPKINEDDELVGYQIDDDKLDIHYWVLGHVKRRPWHYRTDLILGSKQYTTEQLKMKVRNNPRDYKAKIMLTEHMENWEEKIDYIRNNTPRPAPGGVDEENEWQKAWFRVYDECPSYTFVGISSITEYEIPKKYNNLLKPSNPDGVSEQICKVSDFKDTSGSQRQCFLGGLRDEHVIGSFDRIVKLTYKHFLCKQGTTISLYYSPEESFVVPALQITLEEEPTLEKVLGKIAEADPDLYKGLSFYLRYDSSRNAYVSLYRLYVNGFDDFTNHYAYGRAVIDDHFHVSPLDLV